MLLTYTLTSWISKQLAAGDRAHSKQQKKLYWTVPSFWLSLIHHRCVTVCVCLCRSLQSVVYICVCVCVSCISLISSPMWPHRITTVNPPSVTPSETYAYIQTHTRTHTKSPWQLDVSAGASIVPVESSRERVSCLSSLCVWSQLTSSSTATAVS